MNMSVEDIMIKARAQLLLTFPFFGYLAMNLHIKECPKEIDIFKTAATDGYTLYYNADYIRKLYEEDFNLVKSIVIHETLHCVFSHTKHRSSLGKNHMVWNMATDYVVNDAIQKANLPLKNEWLYDKAYEGMFSEEVYDLLMNDKDIKNMISQMERMDHHVGDAECKAIPGFNEGDSKESEDKLERKWKDNVVKASGMDKNAGNISESIQRLIAEIKDPKIKWNEYLRTSFSQFIKSDFNWMKPNKKYFSSGFILPSMDRKNKISIGVAIDVSGSIQSDDISSFMSEINSIVNMFDEFNIHAAYFDTSIHTPMLIKNQSDFDTFLTNIKGGGGTDFLCWWNWIQEDNKLDECDVVLFFTDGYPGGKWINYDMDFSNIYWIVKGSNNEGPIGQTIFYEKV